MTGAIHVFVGPSLPPSQRPPGIPLVFHGPAKQGDVYQLVSSRPLAIAIIDGYFERVPAVWHKEILWAMAEGVHVFGAASMGALRAAELSVFGMRGVGEVYRDFAELRLEDDDEVTLVHGDEASGYRPGSEAMVNVRATLRAARDLGLISEGTQQMLTLHVKECFYPDRSYPEMLEWAAGRVPEAELQRLKAHLKRPEGRVDVKRSDALALVDELLHFQSLAPAPKVVPWNFLHTDAWEKVRSSVTCSTHPHRSEIEGADARVLANLRADAERQVAASRQAMVRALSIQHARRDGYRPSTPDRATALARLCQRHGLADEPDLERWLREQNMTQAELERLVDDEACVHRSETLLTAVSDLHLLDLLRATGDYGRLRRA